MNLDPKLGPCVGSIIIEKVVRTHVPVQTGGDMTLGQMIDASLQESAMADEEVQKIELNIEPEYWRTFCQLVHATASGFPDAYEGEAIPARKRPMR